MDEHQKVAFASLHFTRRADRWYQFYQIGKLGNRWVMFVEVICARFEDLKSWRSVAEINKLQQEGTISEYQDRFDELGVLMLGKNSLSGDYCLYWKLIILVGLVRSRHMDLFTPWFFILSGLLDFSCFYYLSGNGFLVTHRPYFSWSPLIMFCSLWSCKNTLWYCFVPMWSG